MPHVPIWQRCPAGHTRAQAPQWLLSVLVFTHAPPQKVVPVGHAVTHMPFEHASPTLQRLPQRPQCRVFWFVLISQPLVALASQLAKPALQAPSAQALDAHVAVALANAHTRPQAPQLAVIARRSISHPLAGSPSQSAKPVVHAASAQVPLRQAAVALANVQALPHAPQWATVVVRLTSQPLVAFMSQLPNPRLHAREQAPATQVFVPFERAAQAALHAPQLVLLVWRSMHAVPQMASGGVQRSRHVPLKHVALALHARPHAPQLLRSLLRLTSQPLAALMSQLP